MLPIGMRTGRAGQKKLKNNVKYENRVFLQFLLLVTVPLIIMGIVSYYIYVKGENEKSGQALDSYCNSVANEYENVFSSIREYYLDSTSSTSVKWLVNQNEVPYSNYKELRQAQNLLQGNYFLSKYISFYNFINVKDLLFASLTKKVCEGLFFK